MRTCIGLLVLSATLMSGSAGIAASGRPASKSGRALRALSSGLSLSRAMKRLAPCTPRKWDVDKGVEPGREHLAFSARQLVVEPRVRLLPRHRRSLLRCVEPPHRPALDHHVHRPPGLGQCMMISAGWYYSGRRVLRNRCNVRRVDGRCLQIAPGLNA